MFNALDDVSLFGKKVAGFVSGRGASTTAVAFAAPFVPAAQLPMVGLAVGLPIKAAVSSMEHYHREDAVLNNFREEIASYFGIDSDEVTHDNLRALAFGNPKLGIQPQPFFEEILKKNDTSRWVDIGANIGATALAMGFVFAKGAAVAGALSGLASSSGLALLAANPVIAGFIGLSVATALVVHAIDFVITEVSKDAIGMKEKTSYEMLEDIAKHKRDGRTISQDKVMGVIANIDKGLQAEIITTYGAPYNALPEKSRMDILQKYATPLHLEEYCAKINSGSMKINELAFIGAGISSGVEERNIVAVDKPKQHGFAEKIADLQQAYHDKIDGRNGVNAVFRGESLTSTPAAIGNVSSGAKVNDMPNAINFSGGEVVAFEPANVPVNVPVPQTKIASMNEANYGGMMQQQSAIISPTIH